MNTYNCQVLAEQIVNLGNEEKNLSLLEGYVHNIELNNTNYYLYLPESLIALVNKEILNKEILNKHIDINNIHTYIVMHYACNITSINFCQSNLSYLQYMVLHDDGELFSVDIIADDKVFINVLTNVIYYNCYKSIVDNFNNSIFIEQLQPLQNYNFVEKMYINHRIKFWKKNLTFFHTQ